jgi:hypothetical protein
LRVLPGNESECCEVVVVVVVVVIVIALFEKLFSAALFEF